MTDPKHKTIKVWFSTYRTLKKLAAEKPESLAALIDRMASQEPSNDFERAAKALDGLITLRYLREDAMDFNIVDDALRMIAHARNQNPSYPITVALADYMRERGYIE